MPTLDRRTLLVTAAGYSLAAPAVLRAAETRPEDVIVETTGGRLRGARFEGVDRFRGVPYGAAVSGAARFRPAKAAPSWTGVRDAIALGTPSLQDPHTVYGINEPAPGEDCLVLNLWTPSGGGHGRPVMFYCHGGGFTTGSAGSVAQDGARLAREYDVVVIATNHRLGLLGYLYLGELGGEAYAGSGNQGLSDIVLGLEWTRRNVAAFGGDPHNIMVFGESGGGAKTSCLYAMPSVAPLFAKAAIQSGPAVRIGTTQDAARTTRLFLDEMGLAPADWRKLLEIPGPRLLEAQGRLAQRFPGGPPGGKHGIAQFRPGGYGPIVDGALLPHHPFDPAAPAASRDKPLIVGTLDAEAAFGAWASKDAAAFALDEAGLKARVARSLGSDAGKVIDTYRRSRPGASPSDLYFAIESARDMALGTWVIAERKAAQHAAHAFHYNLAYRSNRLAPDGVHEVGAMHAIDIPLVFDNVATPDSLAGSRPDRAIAARRISEMWATFARTGRPAAKGQPAWPAYDLKTRPTMVLDVECHVAHDRFGAERRLWDTVDASGPGPG